MAVHKLVLCEMQKKAIAGDNKIEDMELFAMEENECS
jgi:hypothetical protein